MILKNLLFTIKDMFDSFFNSKSKNITSAATLLAIATVCSRLLGLLRDNLLANLIPKVQTDIYFASFRIPDLVYGILISGGIIAAFLPVFSAEIKKGKEKAQALTNNVLTFFLISLIVLCTLLAIFTPYLIKFLVPGFSPGQQAETILLTRIMFFSPILLGMSAIVSGILQYHNLFLAYSLAPIFYNIGIIAGIVFFFPLFDFKLWALALGVVLGALLHFLVQLPSLFKSGFRIKFSLNLFSPPLRKIFRLMIPRTLGAGVFHLNLIVITAIASSLSPGSISIFNFSNNLQGLPIGLVGISFATAAFPTFSRNFVKKEKIKFLSDFYSIFSQILFLIIPLSLLVFLFRAQIVRLILGTSLLGEGLFGWWQTRLTAASLGIFAFALFANCLIPFLTRIFYSFHNTKTPVVIAVFTVILNIILSFSLVGLFSDGGMLKAQVVDILKLRGLQEVAVIALPLAVSIAALVQFGLLCFFLKRKIKEIDFSRIYQSFLRIFVATLLMGIVVYLLLNLFAVFFPTNTAIAILAQLVFSGGIGLLSYLFFSLSLGCREPAIILSSLKSQLKKES